MHGSRKFCQRGSKLFFHMIGDTGSKYCYKQAIIGSPAKHHLNGVQSLAGRCWLANGSFVIFKWIWTNIMLKNPIFFVIFMGVWTPVSPLWIRPWMHPFNRLHACWVIFHVLCCWLLTFFKNEPPHGILNNEVCATSKASDQPAHMRSLIRAYASHLNIQWVLSYWPKSIWSF